MDKIPKSNQANSRPQETGNVSKDGENNILPSLFTDEPSCNSTIVSNEAKTECNNCGTFRMNDLLEILPYTEIQKLIFGRLDLESKLNCRLVRKDWDQRLSRTLQFNLFFCDETAEVVKNCTKPIHNLNVCDLRTFQYPDEGLPFQSVKNIFLTEWERDFSKGVQKGRISFANLRKLLEQFNQMESLELWWDIMPTEIPFFLKDITFHNLKDLTIICESILTSHFCLELLGNYFPSLQSLFITFRDPLTIIAFNLPTDFDPFHTEIFTFIIRHSEKLKDVSIEREDIIQAEDYVILESSTMEETDERFIIEQLRQMELSIFNYMSTCLDNQNTFAYELLKSQTKLTEIRVMQVNARKTILWNLLPQVLPKCSETLQVLTISGGFGPEDEQTFPCSALQKCSKLKTCHLWIEGIQLSEVHTLPTHIKDLDVGFFSLSSEQIYTIANKLTDLEILNLSRGEMPSLPQGGAQKLNIAMFKHLLKSPRLTKTKLIIDKKTSDLTYICTWITFYGQGFVKFGKPEGERIISEFLITIDRRNFNSDRILL